MEPSCRKNVRDHNFSTIYTSQTGNITDIKWTDSIYLLSGTNVLTILSDTNHTIIQNINYVTTFDTYQEEGFVCLFDNYTVWDGVNILFPIDIDPNYPQLFQIRPDTDYITYLTTKYSLVMRNYTHPMEFETLTFNDSITTFEWSPDGNRLAISFENGTISILEFQNLSYQVIKQNSYENKKIITVIDWKDNIRLVLIAFNYFTLWNLEEDTFITPWNLNPGIPDGGYPVSTTSSIMGFSNGIMIVFVVVRQRQKKEQVG